MTVVGKIDLEAIRAAAMVVPWARLAVLVGTYLFATLFSGLMVRAAFNWTGHALPAPETPAAKSGKLIGKCENILIVTMVLLEAYTALALIFTAKSLVTRSKKADAEYLLGGTLVNVTWSILVALTAKWILANGL